MEERLPIGRKHFVAVFIDTLSKLFPAPQYARQDRIAATRGIEPDGVKHGGFTDTVLSGESVLRGPTAKSKGSRFREIL